MARLVAGRADAITCVSEAISEETRALEPKGPVVTVPNGADFDDVAGLEHHPSERFRITHTGSFFGRRDPRPFLQALRDSGLDVVARFLGDFRERDREWAEGLGLGDHLELLPYAPRATSLALQRDSEALLLLIPEAGGRGKGVLSGKVFEYMAVGRPILAAVPPDGAAADLICATGAGVVASPDDPTAIREALEELHARWRDGGLPDIQLSDEWRDRLSRRTRVEEMAAVLRDVVAVERAAVAARRGAPGPERAWHERPLVRSLYDEWYRLIGERLSAVPGDSVELGSGIATLQRVCPQVRSTDVERTPWTDEVVDAEALPYAEESLANLVLVDVFHHLARPAAFLDEAERTLAPGGRVVVLDPYCSPCRRVYRLFHHERTDLAAAPFAEDETIEADPLASNQARATLVFFRHADELARRWPEARARRASPVGLLAYPLSGGFTGRPLVPPRLGLAPAAARAAPLTARPVARLPLPRRARAAPCGVAASRRRGTSRTRTRSSAGAASRGASG